MLKAIKKSSYTICAGLLAWVAFSYIEIITKCLDNPVYSKFNLFNLIF